MKKATIISSPNKVFLVVYLAIILTVFFTFNSWRGFREYPYQFTYGSDVNQYYSYLPQTFIQKDPGFRKISKKINKRKYWLEPNEKNIRLPRFTFGMSILYSPFFFTGHCIALNSHYEVDGYTLPYSISLIVGTYIYLSIALYLLYLCLLYFFKPWISGLSVFLIFVSTNLFYYTLSEGEMSHSYLFFLYSVIIYNTLKWSRSNKLKNLIIIALISGLAILIRPTSILIILFPAFYIMSKKENVRYLVQHFRQVIACIVLCCLPFFLQMMYWKFFGETWIRYGYGTERFYFNSPQIVKFLFGYRSGWLLYTPIMIFSIFGLFIMPKKINSMKWSIPLILVLTIYILSSWWCWWFVGFGLRSMIEFYALLIFPLAVFIEKIAKIKYVNYLFIGIFFFTSFSTIKMDGEQRKIYEKALKSPDNENARLGKQEYSE